jgi:hypothetical protein
MKELLVDQLKVRIYLIERKWKYCKDDGGPDKHLLKRMMPNVIFAAAASQNESLKHFVKNVNWSKVNAFHMDEHNGSEDAPTIESFRR